MGKRAKAFSLGYQSGRDRQSPDYDWRPLFRLHRGRWLELRRRTSLILKNKVETPGCYIGAIPGSNTSQTYRRIVDGIVVLMRHYTSRPAAPEYESRRSLSFHDDSY